MKKQVKVYKGYVPKGETLKKTIHAVEVAGIDKYFAMHGSKKGARFLWDDAFVKRTITITSEDEEVK